MVLSSLPTYQKSSFYARSAYSPQKKTPRAHFEERRMVALIDSLLLSLSSAPSKAASITALIKFHYCNDWEKQTTQLRTCSSGALNVRNPLVSDNVVPL